MSWIQYVTQVTAERLIEPNDRDVGAIDYDIVCRHKV